MNVKEIEVAELARMKEDGANSFRVIDIRQPAELNGHGRVSHQDVGVAPMIGHDDICPIPFKAIQTLNLEPNPAEGSEQHS